MAGNKITGLGRGLSAIFEDNTMTSGKQTSLLRISEIEPRANQPRKEFDEEALKELSESISTHGLIQPIVVRENESGFYSIIAGERRWRAAKIAGLNEVPTVILDVDDAKAAELALVENIQRENLNPIEEALAYDTLANEYGLTQDEISQRIGKSRSFVANSVRLLDLPEEVKRMVSAEKLSAGHARTLLGLQNKELLSDTAELIVKKQLNVRETEALVKKLNKQKPTEQTEQIPKIDYAKELEKKLQTRMGRRVIIKDKGKNKSITFEYSDNDDLENIIKKLGGANILDEE